MNADLKHQRAEIRGLIATIVKDRMPHNGGVIHVDEVADIVMRELDPASQTPPLVAACATAECRELVRSYLRRPGEPS